MYRDNNWITWVAKDGVLMYHSDLTGLDEELVGTSAISYYGEQAVLDKINFKRVNRFIDWQAVPIDTLVLVSTSGSLTVERRHFAGLVDGYPSVWKHGKTSWTAEESPSSKFLVSPHLITIPESCNI